jgi:hypothetical protein
MSFASGEISAHCSSSDLFALGATMGLNRSCDDGIFLFIMLFNTARTLERLTDYTKLPDGTWAAEVRVLRLRVTGMTPTDCKHELLSELDARLAAWLASIAQGDSCSPAGLTPP